MKKNTPLELHLIQGPDTLKVENIISLFEKLKGRKATAQEERECVDQIGAIKPKPF